MSTNTILTAKEGADRVAQRYREMRRQGTELDEDEDGPGYQCEHCGGDTFDVANTYKVKRSLKYTLACTCGETDVAAEREVEEWEGLKYIGTLDDVHRVDRWDREDSFDREEVDEDVDVHCDQCHSAFVDDPHAEWEFVPSEEPDEAVEDSDDYEVYCTGCGHEVEFGWSHENRGGRIWPCEARDFNPWRCFAEERFVEDWKRRGWLRPNRPQ